MTDVIRRVEDNRPIRRVQVPTIARRVEGTTVVHRVESTTVARRVEDNRVVHRLGAQGQPGPRGPAGTIDAVTYLSRTLTAGGPGVVFARLDDDFLTHARATTEALSRVVGLQTDDAIIPPGNESTIAVSGILVRTTTFWDGVIGGSGGLVGGRKYYLAAFGLGRMIDETELGDLDPGDFQVEIGLALNPTTLLIRIQPEVAV